MSERHAVPEPTKLDVSQRHKVHWPRWHEVLRNPACFVAFGFGIGLLRPGSGTWGSVLAVVLWPLLISADLSWFDLGVFIAATFFLGCVACGKAGRALGVDDHVGMVWDEIVAVWMLFWALPQNVWVLMVAFVLFRIFDVAKPFPIRRIDAALKGGFGVMFDDVIAAFYAWVLCAGGLKLLSMWGVSL